MTETVTLKHKAKKSEQEATAENKTTRYQLQQLSLKFDGLAFCELSNQAPLILTLEIHKHAIKNIKLMFLPVVSGEADVREP